MSMNTVPERLAALRAAMAANGVAVYLIPVGDPATLYFVPESSFQGGVRFPTGGKVRDHPQGC